MTPPVRLRTALTPLGHHRALLDGSVGVRGAELDLVEVTPHSEIFKQMGASDSFDLCELSIITYLAGREFGREWTALPVVPRHSFHHRDLVVNAKSGITSPGDLEGGRVGARSWTATPGVHDRGILTDEYGVDLDSIDWIVYEPEHIPECGARNPPNVQMSDVDDLFPQLVSGELPAGIVGANRDRRTSDLLVPLFPDAAELDAAQYARTGIVPPFTVIVVHDRVADPHPWLLEALWDAFSAARQEDFEPGPGVGAIVRGDPMPYGLEANRAGFDELLRLGREQGILRGTARVDDLFAAVG